MTAVPETTTPEVGKARTRKEDGWFRDWITRNAPTWSEAFRRSARRRDEPDDIYFTYESPLPTG